MAPNYKVTYDMEEGLKTITVQTKTIQSAIDYFTKRKHCKLSDIKSVVQV